MTPSLGIEPGPHWWETSALTTATLHHNSTEITCRDITVISIKQSDCSRLHIFSGNARELGWISTITSSSSWERFQKVAGSVAVFIRYRWKKWIIYWTAVMNVILAIESWKIQDFNGVWTRDLAIPVRRSNQRSNQLSYAICRSKYSCNEWINERNDIWFISYIISFITGILGSTNVQLPTSVAS